MAARIKYFISHQVQQTRNKGNEKKTQKINVNTRTHAADDEV